MTASSAQNFTWTGLAADSTVSPPPARHSAAMGAINSQFYVFGGRGNKMNGTEVFGKITLFQYLQHHVQCQFHVQLSVIE